MFLAVHSGDATGVFDTHHTLFEETLPPTRQDDGLSICIGQGGISLHLEQFVFLPLHKADCGSDQCLVRDTVSEHQVARLCPKQVDKGASQLFRNSGEIDACSPAPLSRSGAYRLGSSGSSTSM